MPPGFGPADKDLDGREASVMGAELGEGVTDAGRGTTHGEELAVGRGSMDTVDKLGRVGATTEADEDINRFFVQ